MTRFPLPVSDEDLVELHAWFAPERPFTEWVDEYRGDLAVEYAEAWR